MRLEKSTAEILRGGRLEKGSERGKRGRGKGVGEKGGKGVSLGSASKRGQPELSDFPRGSPLIQVIEPSPGGGAPTEASMFRLTATTIGRARPAELLPTTRRLRGKGVPAEQSRESRGFSLGTQVAVFRSLQVAPQIASMQQVVTTKKRHTLNSSATR